jgi:anti-sigma factor RsiW
MSTGEQPAQECPGIDEEVIESYVLGRLGEGPVSQHIDTCDACKLRVAECRAYIEALKRGLREL